MNNGTLQRQSLFVIRGNESLRSVQASHVTVTCISQYRHCSVSVRQSLFVIRGNESLRSVQASHVTVTCISQYRHCSVCEN
jgi:hypothetical protein